MWMKKLTHNNLKKLSVTSCIVLFVVTIIFPNDVFAQLPNPLGGVTDIRIIIGRIINAFLGIIGAVALFMFVLGGYRWLISAGNANQVEAGKKTLVWATLGLLVVFSSYLIVSFLISAFTS